MLTLYIT
ncbi:MATE efflux family protein, partial [Vibrio harveyi]